MKKLRSGRRNFITCVAALFGSLATGASLAQSDVIKIIVPFPPGATADPVGRAAAERIRVHLKKQTIVDNRSGAGSIIGTQALAASAPDGLTIGMVAGPFVLNPALRSKLPYDTEKDFAPITRHLRMPLVLAVHPDVPAKNIEEFVAFAKANQKKTAFAIPAPGTFGDIATRQFLQIHKLDSPIIPYKGGGQAVLDLIGGQVSAMFETLGTIHAHAKAGKLRIIAVTAAKRMIVLPDVQTMAEASYKDFEYSAFFGWVAPAGTPQDKLNAFANAINDLSTSEKANLIAQGFELVPDTPAQFAAALRADIQRWRIAVKELGIATQ